MTTYTLFIDITSAQYVTNGDMIIFIGYEHHCPFESLDAVASAIDEPFGPDAWSHLVKNASAGNLLMYSWMLDGRIGHALGDFNHPIIDTMTV